MRIKFKIIVKILKRVKKIEKKGKNLKSLSLFIQNFQIIFKLLIITSLFFFPSQAAVLTHLLAQVVVQARSGIHALY